MTGWPNASAGPHAAAFDRAALKCRWTLAHAWAPWERTADPDVWDWFARALELPAGWTRRGTVEAWAREGLFPGVARVVVGPDGLVDPDALTLAPDDWPDAGRVLAGRPVVTWPVVTGAALLGPRVAEVLYIGLDGATVARFGQAPAPCWIGRDPAGAAASGYAMRVYPSALAWAKAALEGRDNFDDVDGGRRWPGGGAILDLDGFLETWGARVPLDFGRDAAAASAYERRRKAVLRPKRPALPPVLKTETGRAAA